MADVGGRTTATARSSETGTSIVTGGPEVNVRLEVWTSARHAIARRPIVGSGPGQFGGATSRDRTLRVARIEGSEVIYTDAHNIVVEHLVTTGVLGAAVLVVWLLLAFRQAQGTLAWFAGGALVMNLLQPMDAGTTSLLFLTLGVAAPITFAPALRRSIAPVGVALVAAGVLLVGDLQLGRAIEHRDLDRARAANALLRPWPQPASVLGDIHTRQWLEGRESVDSALEWRRVALSRDPTNPGLAIGLAEVEWRSGRLREAEQHFQQAVEHNPWSVVALSRLAKLAHARGDDELAERYARRALEVEPNDDMTRMLERIEQRAS
jgi:hypothetical protein